ncbi:TlpA family protein disulfide reductase [Thalassotalea aquiviva]|uniref:TlpA family protein disulfide reductase n=1 Tax=Thalassotalea aquiviva TaxID=3242415 RepID=UPI00352A7FBE
MSHRYFFSVIFVILVAFITIAISSVTKAPNAVIGKNWPQWSLPIVTPFLEHQAGVSKGVKLERGGQIDQDNAWQLINVWATWCAPCREEMPWLQQASDKLEQIGVEIKLYSIDTDRNLIKEFMLSSGVNLPTYVVKREQLELKLNTDSYPSTYLVSANGKIVAFYQGAREWQSEQVLKEIQQLKEEYEQK